MPQFLLPLLLLSLLLTACAAGPPSAPSDLGGGPTPTDARRWLLDAEHSEVLVLVYRGGRLARFGHNHLLRLQGLEGWLDLAEPITETRLQLTFPVADLALDEPALRAQEGAEFASPLRPADIAATRRNLLGPALLDAENYPLIQVDGRVLGGAFTQLDLELALQVRAHLGRRRLSVAWQQAADTLGASGEFDLLQSEVGLTPFSLLMGALRVEDRMLLRYRLQFRAAE